MRIDSRALLLLGLSACAAPVEGDLPHTAADGVIRVNVGPGGMQAAEVSDCASVTADGRYAIFWSRADGLDPGDDNRTNDVFRADLRTGEVRLVSVGPDGAQGTNSTSLGLSGVASGDGRYVLFNARSDAMLAEDDNRMVDLYRKDMETGGLELIHADAIGGVLSADGRVALVTVSEDRDVTQAHVLRLDLESGKCDRIAPEQEFSAVGDFASGASLSADGSRAVVATYRSQLGEVEPGWEFLVIDEAPTRRTRRLLLEEHVARPGGMVFGGLLTADGAELTAGRWNRGEGALESGFAVYVVDAETLDCERLDFGDDPRPPEVVGMSMGGRFLVFQTSQSLTVEDTNTNADIYLQDRETGDLRCLSLNIAGQAGNGASYRPSISADGGVVVFCSEATDLVHGDTNGVADVFAVRLR